MAGPIHFAMPFAAALALCALRWLPTIMLVPAFAGHALSGLARTAVALAFALPVAPSVAAALARAPLPLAHWAGLATKEAALGIVLASLIAAPFWAIQAAGTYLDYQRGGNPQALDPAASVDASVLGAMLQQALVVYLIHTGGLHALFDVIGSSYALWPALDALPPLGLQAWEPIGALVVSTMRFALSLAFPYLLALGAIESCFAVLSRVNSKFPAYVAALPFKSVMLLLIIAISMPRLLDAAGDIAARHAVDVRRLMQEIATAAQRVATEAQAASKQSSIADER